MKKKIFLGTIVILMIWVVFITAGCSTTIPVTYTEPARLNLSGVRRIAIKSNDAQLANNISQRLSASGVFSIASAAELSEWEQWFPLYNLQATAIEVNSADLVAAYKANAARADQSYGRRLVKTSGTVAEIGQSSRGRFYARLNVGNDAVAVYFASSELNALASINRGQTITVIGMNHGFNLPDMEDTAEILRILGAGQRVNIVDATFPVGDYPGTIDAILTINKDTRVQEGSSVQTRREQAGRDGDGNIIYRNVNVTIYERQVTVNIAYQIARALNGASIGQGSKTANSSRSSSEDRSRLTSASQLEANTIGRPLQELVNEIVPIQRTISLTLARSDDDRAKNEMRVAENLAKSRDYAGAAAAYGRIYAEYGNFAAGYNQAIITEASEGTEKAIELMVALIQRHSDNPTAQNTLNEMRRRETANQRSAEQLSR